ncbi:MAG TPA: outer membrane beta-barrel protein [Longimicrobiales bacterium]|nr:outer membrane beta-barrel protein [Longimicrobiales bacterium]
MPSRFLTTVLAALVLVAASATDGAAQNIDSPYRFVDTNQAGGVYAGYLFSGLGALGLGPDKGLVVGVRYDLNVGSGPFALEADVGYFSSLRAVYDTVPGDTTRAIVGDSDFSTLMLSAGIRFNLTGPRTWRGLQPYALFGAGFALDLASPSAVDEALPNNVRVDFGTSFMGMLGGGAEIFLGDRYSLRIDARNILWKLETPEAFLIKADQALLLPADEWTQNFGLTAGLAIRF